MLLSARTDTPTRRLGTLSWIIILVGAPALIISASRSAWVALLGALLVAGIVRLGKWLNGPQRIQRALVVSSLTVSAVLFSFYAVVPQLDPYEGAFLARRVGSFIDLGGDSSLLLRIQVWGNALTVWTQHPWIGWGVGAYGDLFRMPYSTRIGWISNLFIHHLFDTGLLGLVAFTSAVSLAVMLAMESYRRTLRLVETVVIDEVHAIAGNKRGAHLSLLLESLEELSENGFNRVALSATVAPLERVAQFVAGGDRPCEIVDHRRLRSIRIDVEAPFAGAIAPLATVAQTAVELSAGVRTSLVFTNVRSQAERAIRSRCLLHSPWVPVDAHDARQFRRA